MAIQPRQSRSIGRLCRDDLGWPTEGVVGQEFRDEFTGAAGTIAIFTLDDGGLMLTVNLMLTLNERANLAKDASATRVAQLRRVQPGHPGQIAG
jgi:hypothetical protein